MAVPVGCIVEGHGEVLALPILLRRVAALLSPSQIILPAIRRVKKTQLMRMGELERAVEALTRQIGRSAPILVLLDADDDCPVLLAQSLSERCRKAHADVRVSIVIANREYEAWFLAAAESLSGECGLPADLIAPANPETIRGAKEWLSAYMGRQSKYTETIHQPKFSALINQARTTRSFSKLEKETLRILQMASSRRDY